MTKEQREASVKFNVYLSPELDAAIRVEAARVKLSKADYITDVLARKLLKKKAA